MCTAACCSSRTRSGDPPAGGGGSARRINLDSHDAAAAAFAFSLSSTRPSRPRMASILPLSSGRRSTRLTNGSRLPAASRMRRTLAMRQTSVPTKMGCGNLTTDRGSIYMGWRVILGGGLDGIDEGERVCVCALFGFSQCCDGTRMDYCPLSRSDVGLPSGYKPELGL